MSPIPDPRAIRELAYRLWEERGRPEESADDLWLEAERQLTIVHAEFTRSEVPTLNVTAQARAESMAAQDPEYSPEHPPVNAEFKWAAAEMPKSSSGTAAGQKQPAGRPTRR